MVLSCDLVAQSHGTLFCFYFEFEFRLDQDQILIDFISKIPFYQKPVRRGRNMLEYLGEACASNNVPLTICIVKAMYALDLIFQHEERMNSFEKGDEWLARISNFLQSNLSKTQNLE